MGKVKYLKKVLSLSLFGTQQYWNGGMKNERVRECNEPVGKRNQEKEQAENKIKLLKQKKSKLKRNAETKRKVQKGGVFEAFEREITGMQEETNNDLIYAFLDYVLSDNRNREKLKELTEIHLREKEISLEENSNLEEENANDDFEEPTEEEKQKMY